MKFKAINKNTQFVRAYRKGVSKVTPLVVTYVLKNRYGHTRIGITASKKLGHAVVRNRIRRRIREVYRLNESRFQPGWDIVVVARSRCLTVSFAKLSQSYLALAEKAGILEPIQ